MTIASVLLERAAQQPNALAYRVWRNGEHETLTYSTLLDRAASLGAQIQAACYPGDRVALVFDTGLDYVCSLFACLLTGRVAVPAYPPRSNRHGERISGIIDDAECRLLLTDSAYAGRLADARTKGRPECPVIVVDPGYEGDEAGLRLSLPHDEDIALLQYTSGSTARPKGVVLLHRHINANLAMLRQALEPGPDSAGVSWLPPYHDMGLIGGLLFPLYCGFPVTLIAPAVFLQRPRTWLEAISETRASISPSPDFGYRHCVARIGEDAAAGLNLSRWRHALTGAERVRQHTMDAFAARFRGAGFDARAFFPCYGLAEATLFVSGRSGRDPGRGSNRRQPAGATEDMQRTDTVVSCGRPAAGVAIRIDGAGANAGQIGEILVRSPALASGYWRNPVATEEAFFKDGAGHSHSQTHGAGWLRTGDLGFLQGGELFVSGRAKELIIIRGRNLFPTDIEAIAERASPHIVAGGVAAFGLEQDGEERLCIVAEVARAPGIDYAEVAGAVRSEVGNLAETAVYDIRLIRRGSLPRTSSGKTQRLRCRELYRHGAFPGVAIGAADGPATGSADDLKPGTAMHGSAASTANAPATDIEICLMRAWSQAFARPCSLDDDFFALGGDSLKCVELVTAARDQGLSLRYEDVYAFPTIRRLATHACIAGSDALAPILPDASVDFTQPVPLAPQQRRYWKDYRLDVRGPSWSHIYREISFPAPLDLDRVSAALLALAERHPALRLGFACAASGEVMQQLHTVRRIEIAHHDLRGLPAATAALRLAALARATACDPFDLERPPLLRVVSVRKEERMQQLLFCFHHLVCDAQSLMALQAELMAELAAAQPQATDGKAITASAALGAASYLDYITWLRRHYVGSVAWQLDRAYWLDRLHGVEHRRHLAVAAELERDSDEGIANADYRGRACQYRIPDDLLAQASVFCEQNQVSLFALFLAMLAIHIARSTNERDILIGSPAAGRELPELKNLLGLFINLVVLRIQVDPAEDSFLDVVRRSQHAIFSALSHQLYQLDDIARDLGLPPAGDRFPLTTSFFSAIRFAEACPDMRSPGPACFSELATDVRFEFMAYLLMYRDGAVLDLRYRKALFADQTIAALGASLLSLARDATSNPLEKAFPSLSG
ncbi:MAG: hypothetical protein JWP36_924 [Paucimonas sp.]|nr:hypothetical protein [Paucimonas sp.]